jgi:type II secretory pathway pseudopilin PulG
VIVVIIMASVSAIAIPRITRAADGADVAAMWTDTEVLNKAVDMYRFEHGVYPTAGNINKQLSLYSNAAGTMFGSSPDAANGVVLGPYVLRVPPMPLGPNEGSTKIAATAGPGVGWIYDQATFAIIPNLVDEGSGTIPDYVITKLNLPSDQADAFEALATGGGGAMGGGGGK